jgi:hypothetical protein
MKRITCFAGLVIAFAWGTEVRAGGPPPVYIVIDKVVFEPDEEAPTRIQIWGAFALLREGNAYGSPVRGYLYYTAAPGAEEKCRKEWAVLKKLTNKKQLISFGHCGAPCVRDHLRKPSERVARPIVYPHGKGGFALGKHAESNFPSLKKLLISAATPVVAADSTRIDRRIAKEPVYQSESAKYCLLVFGAEAKTRVWLVLDGDTLYVDRNANRDLTEANERVRGNGSEFEASEITELAGKAKYAHLRLKQFDLPDRGEERLSMISLEVRDKLRQYGIVQFADRPEVAPLLHFDGPLTMGLTDPDKQVLERGDTGSQITAWIGTPSPAKQRGATVYLEHSQGIPSDIHPIASIEFPNQNPQGNPITIRAVLNQRC